jgi:hypothetical protein
MMRKGRWTLLPASSARKLKGIRISPIGVAPQRNLRSRTILDYSCYDVNDDTAPVTPNDSMQFGRALHRILCVVLEVNPRFGPVYMCKIDITDGFYRVWLLPADIPKLGVIFLTEDGNDPLIGFPLALPMGWVNSLPHFPAAAETICDLASASLMKQSVFPPHALDTMSEMPVPNKLVLPPKVVAPSHYAMLPEAANIPVVDQAQHPVATHDVYVNDFVSMVQGN